MGFAYAFFLGGSTLAPQAHAQTSACTLEIVSLRSSGQATSASSVAGMLSADGRYAVFSSSDASIVSNDTNASSDVFVRDRVLGTTLLVSATPAGVPCSAGAAGVGISADGRFVVFGSSSPDLVPGDTGDPDLFVRDLVLGTTELANVDSSGAQATGDVSGAGISADGMRVAFGASDEGLVPGDTNGFIDIFLRDRAAGTTLLLSVGLGGAAADGESVRPFLSGDGRWVSFESLATNLVPGDTNARADIFVVEVASAAIERVSVDDAGQQATGTSAGSALSGDGRFVVFASRATNLVPGDTNGWPDVFVRDRLLGTTRRASAPFAGQANGESYGGSITQDGRFLAFASRATNLVTGDFNGYDDVFVKDLQLGTLRRIVPATSALGFEASESSFGPILSADGRFLTFTSNAGNLVANDANGQIDAFLEACDLAPTLNVCAGDGTGSACPCGNTGAAGRGCDNSFSTGGAWITGTGTASVSADALRLDVAGLPPTQPPVIFLQGEALSAGGAGLVAGDGVLCIGNPFRRLGSRPASNGMLSFGYGIPTDPSIAARGALPPSGGVRYYQAWYRNAQSFCTPITFNYSNAVRVVWVP